MAPTMRAAIAREPGAVDVLQIETVEAPVPKQDEILIRVKAFGLNKAEAYNRQGKHGGFSGQWAVGIEESGEVAVDQLGQFAPGQKVVTAMGGMMFDRHGSYAEIIAVKRSNVIPVGIDIDFETLATLPEAYLTAWGALEHNLQIEEGQTLLVRGATTTIGMAAIAYAKALGLQVIATTRQADRVARLKSLGADHVVLDTGEIYQTVLELVPKGVDAAIELVGAVTIKDTLKSVRKWGSAVFVGFVGGAPILEQFHFMNDLPNTVRLSFFGSGLLGKEDLPLDKAPITWIAKQVQAETMASIHARTVPFEQIQDAHRLLESNEAFGKIVVSHMA